MRIRVEQLAEERMLKNTTKIKKGKLKCTREEQKHRIFLEAIKEFAL